MTSQERSIHRVTTTIAGIIALLLSVLIPAGYFSVSYQYMVGSLDSQAEINAHAITSLVTANPTMWYFEQIRLAELLERRSSTEISEGRRILDRQGGIIAEHVDPLAPPIVVRSHDIYDAGVSVATMEISRSLRPLLLETAGVAFGALLCGGLVFVVLRTLPLRVVRRAHRSLTESENKFHSIYDSMKEGLALYRIVTGPDGRAISFSVIEVNPACESILGQKRQDVIGSDGAELFNGAILENLPEAVRIMGSGEQYTFELEQPETKRCFNVSLFSPQEGLFATLLEDVTERKKYEEQIQRLAYFDSLTGLPIARSSWTGWNRLWRGLPERVGRLRCCSSTLITLRTSTIPRGMPVATCFSWRLPSVCGHASGPVTPLPGWEVTSLSYCCLR